MTSGRIRLHAMTAGGHTPARRQLIALAVGAALLLIRPALATAQTDPDSQISIRENDGVYTIAARFTISQSAAAARAVLTDYQQLPRFMPDLRASKVLERHDNHVVVEQEARPHLLMFSKDVHLVLDVREEPGKIQFRDRCGRNFTSYEGEWTIAEQHGRTIVSYGLRVQPAFDVPGFVLTRLLKRDAARMIERLKEEIATRLMKSAPDTSEAAR